MNLKQVKYNLIFIWAILLVVNFLYIISRFAGSETGYFTISTRPEFDLSIFAILIGFFIIFFAMTIRSQTVNPVKWTRIADDIEKLESSLDVDTDLPNLDKEKIKKFKEKLETVASTLREASQKYTIGREQYNEGDKKVGEYNLNSSKYSLLNACSAMRHIINSYSSGVKSVYSTLDKLYNDIKNDVKNMYKIKT